MTTTTDTQLLGRYPTEVDATIVANIDPVDRIRWGAIFGGLFAALTTLILLNILGIAIGLAIYDPQDSLSNFGIGAGVWGALATLVAFIVGGWLAARTAAVVGQANGILNGAMVWVVSIPLLLFFASSGVGSVIGSTVGAVSSVTGTTLETVAPAVSQAVEAAVSEEDIQAVQATAQAAGQELTVADARVTAQAIATQIAPSPQQVDSAAATTSAGAFGVFMALLLGFGAAALGGFLGARTLNTDEATASA